MTMAMNRQFDVVVAGELNVDIILNEINKFPEMGKEVLARKMTITLGSSSAIFASNLSALGTNVAFTGTLARDSFGELMLTSLQRKKVNTDHIIFTDEKSTGATIALSFDEDRAMVTYPGAMSLFEMTHIPETLFHGGRHLHVSSIFLSTGLKKDIHKLFKKAKASGMTTSLDPQWDPEERWDIDFRQLLEVVDVFIPNESELRAMTGVTDIGKAVEQLRAKNNIFIVKSGRDGAFLWKGETFIHQPAFLNDNVVDTIGAGDSFGAGFIHKFIQEKPLKECLEFAALAGAISTTRAGGTTAFEDITEIKAIAESTFNYKF